MSAAPLADLLAAASPDPGELDELRARIARAGGYTEPWEPAAGIVVATRSLPLGAAPGPGEAAANGSARAAGLAVAQGEDELAASGRSWEQVADLVSERPGDLAELPGDFGLVGARRGSATVVRSAGGLVPFYVHDAGGGRWSAATTLAGMLALHSGRLAPDPLVNAIWTSGYDAAPDRRTFLEGVRVVGRGEYARLGQDGTMFGAWWHPRPEAEPAPLSEPSPEHAERLRAALLRTLDRELDPDHEIALALSGGVDSSAIGALARGMGRTVSAFTILPEDEAARERDSRYVESLADEVGFERRLTFRVDDERRLALMSAPGVPFHVLQPYLCLLPEVAAEWPEATTLLGGEFADHTVGSTVTMPDWAHHTSPGALWSGRSRLPAGPIDIRRWFTNRLRRALRRPPMPWAPELPAMIRPELREEYREWHHGRRRLTLDDERPMPYLAMLLERQGFLGMHWEVTSSLGMRRCFPFVTREILELAFECHPAELVGPGTKRLLRAALKDDVPAFNLERTDKGRAGSAREHAPRAWHGEVPAALEPILAPGWPPSGEVPYWDLCRTNQLVVFSRVLEKSRQSSQ